MPIAKCGLCFCKSQVKGRVPLGSQFALQVDISTNNSDPPQNNAMSGRREDTFVVVDVSPSCIRLGVGVHDVIAPPRLVRDLQSNLVLCITTASPAADLIPCAAFHNRKSPALWQ